MILKMSNRMECNPGLFKFLIVGKVLKLNLSYMMCSKGEFFDC